MTPRFVTMAEVLYAHERQLERYGGVSNRTGLAAALTFLGKNGVFVRHGTDALFELTKSVACGELDKPAVTKRLVEIAQVGR